MKGAYVVSGSDVKDLVIIGTGSETAVAAESAKSLAAKGIKARVVSMPCVELFLAQDQQYRDTVIPPGARKVSIEAGTTIGWERIVGDGLKIGINHYGASAPGELLSEKFGFAPAGVAEQIEGWVKGKK